MLHDDSPAIRELGVRRILKARNEETLAIRKFTLPKLNFEAPNYVAMIDWQKCQLEEPPSTRKLSSELIKDIIISKKELLSLTHFVNHTQAVERVIKIVTDASSAVVGEDKRDGLIRARLKGKKLLPKFKSKKDFVINN